jgi:D-aminopeptidase
MMNWLLLVDEARLMRRLFDAVVEGVEEAVLNALWRAETVVGRDGHTLYALPLEKVAAWVGAGAWSAGASR